MLGKTLGEYTAGLASTALSRIPKQPLLEDKMPYRGSLKNISAY